VSNNRGWKSKIGMPPHPAIPAEEYRAAMALTIGKMAHTTVLGMRMRIGLTSVAAAIVLLLSSDCSLSTSRRVAYIGSEASAALDAPFQRFRKVFLRGAGRRGDVALEYVQGDDKSDQALESAIRIAAGRRPSVLVTPTGATAAVARRVAPDIPNVFSTYLEPVRGGFADSLDSPGHRRTGISLADTLDDKRLEILKDAYPRVRTVAVLGDRDWVTLTNGPARVLDQARRSGLDVSLLEAESIAEVEALLNGPAAAKYDAWYITPTYVTYIAQAQIIAILRRIGKPAMFASQEEVLRGGLLGYSQDTAFVWDAVVALVDRVLAGEDPGNIPVERPRRFVLAVRVSDSPLGRAMNAAVVRRADFVY